MLNFVRTEICWPEIHHHVLMIGFGETLAIAMETLVEHNPTELNRLELISTTLYNLFGCHLEQLIQKGPCITIPYSN